MKTTTNYQQPTLIEIGSVVDETLGVSFELGEIENTRDPMDGDI